MLLSSLPPFDRTWYSWPVALALLWANSAIGEEPVDYARQIKPVLQARCYACHGALKQQAELRLDTAMLILKGGDGGAAIDPAQAGESLLLKRVSAAEESERMPPEGEPLSAAQISLLKTWISQGAKGPPDEQPERDPRSHWAFQTPVRPKVPVVPRAVQTGNAIDAFIAAEQAKRSLTPQPPADKRIWLRRVYLDLIGLPPTRGQLDEFLADESPQAEELVVDRLLASPQYGERWGRHWMDIWRYSDWWGLGAEVRNSQKHIWHWRDWIVESQNADKGYDQMLREMLAADELYPNDFDRLRASGFLARQYFKFNRTSWLDETVEHTSKAMLGLTYNCAKCHDHKYDPLTQADYYRLRAIFEPYQVRTEMVKGETDFERDGIPRGFDCNLDAPTFLHVRGDERNPDKSRPLEPAVPAFLSHAAWKISPVSLPPEAQRPGLRALVLENYLAAAEQKIAAARAALAAKPAGTDSEDQARLAAVVAEKNLAAALAQPTVIRARYAAEKARASEPPAADVATLAREAVKLERQAALAQAEAAVAQAELELARAAADKKSEVEKKLVTARAAVEPARQAVETPAENFTPLAGALKMFESNLESEESRRKPYPATSTGRRTALANWLTDPRHPLPARVAVNHLWLRHFGRPLVATVFDFGRKGASPSHPELLDWLAVELVEHDWSLKHLHRLMVTSQAYCRSSSSAGAPPETLARDPDNRFLWRANPIRMEAQVVRDSLLHLADELDLARGGPPIPVTNEASRRRGLYFVHSHNEHQPFLSIFDDAGVLDCYRRAESILPQQALALENSAFAAGLAEKISRRISAAAPGSSDREFLRSAFLNVLCTEPSEAELTLATEGLTRLADAARRNNRPDPAAAARANLVHALLNHNDFITVR